MFAVELEEPTDTVSEAFPDSPIRGHLHIIVQPPLGARMRRFIILFLILFSSCLSFCGGSRRPLLALSFYNTFYNIAPFLSNPFVCSPRTLISSLPLDCHIPSLYLLRLLDLIMPSCSLLLTLDRLALF